MNLKLIYGLFFGIFSFILASMLSLFGFDLTGGHLGIYVYLNGLLSAWPISAPFWVFVFLFFLIIVSNVLFGMRYGAKLAEASNQNKIARKAKRHLILLFFVLIISCTLWGLDLNIRKKEYAGLALNLRDINAIELTRADKRFVVSTKINGFSKGRYCLTINLISASYVKAPLVKIFKIITLYPESRGIDFEISFEQLSKVYRRELYPYVPDFENEHEFNEVIIIEATLGLWENDQYAAPVIAMLDFPKSKAAALAIFKFRCKGDLCEIVKSED